MDGPLGLSGTEIVCANPECGKSSVSVSVSVRKWWRGSDGTRSILKDEPVLTRRLIPEGFARPVANYVPKAIRDDYAEACLIRDLSPKASATLARRCLQGMIRDFAKPAAKNDKLFEEIKALELAISDGTAPREISEDSVAALTAVRKIGNIGAHMEADVNVIVDVDAGEAQVLIELIESLLQDWYVERYKRQQRFAATVALGAQKAQELAAARVGQAALPSPDDLGEGSDRVT